MANAWAGEVALVIDGRRHVLKLTLGSLAEMEAALPDESLPSLVRRFEEGRFTTRDVLALIVAGLRGGGLLGERFQRVAATAAASFCRCPSSGEV